MRCVLGAKSFPLLNLSVSLRPTPLKKNNQLGGSQHGVCTRRKGGGRAATLDARARRARVEASTRAAATAFAPPNRRRSTIAAPPPPATQRRKEKRVFTQRWWACRVVALGRERGEDGEGGRWGRFGRDKKGGLRPDKPATSARDRSVVLSRAQQESLSKLNARLQKTMVFLFLYCLRKRWVGRTAGVGWGGGRKGAANKRQEQKRQKRRRRPLSKYRRGWRCDCACPSRQKKRGAGETAKLRAARRRQEAGGAAATKHWVGMETGGGVEVI